MKVIAPSLAIKDHYRADACIVWCFDDRFSKALDSYIIEKGLVHLDIVKIAGGAKELATPSDEHNREFVLGQILASIRLHHTRRVVLMNHADCGAYGGSKVFGDNKREKDFHQRELEAGRDFLAKHIPGVPIDIIYVDFDNVQEL